METILTYSVRELHIDLLFLEEFYSSENFRKWFINNTVGIDSNIIKVLRTDHSVFELERESDLEIAFEGSKGEVLFLIENKINAQFQPNQADDYKNRGTEYIRRGKCAEFYTILFAPEAYIQLIKLTHKFDFYLSYEKVILYFETQDQMGERAKYKINVLKKAIEKYNNSNLRTKSSSSDYQPSEINQGITEFWERYWEDLSERFPNISMPQPGEKGPASTFIGLGKSALPSKVIIYHKFVHGFVDLQFDSLGEKADAFINHFQSHLEDEMTIQKVGKSGVAIRIEVPKINPHKFYEELQDDVYIAQKSAKKLIEWFQMNFNLWITFNSQYK